MKTEDIMLRLGKSLDNQVIEDKWCRENGIWTGSDYLWHWLAFSIHRPEWRIPVLVFCGPPDSGKSVFAKLLRAFSTGKYRFSHGNQLMFHGQYFNSWVERYVFFSVTEADEKYWLSENQKRFLSYVYDENLVLSKMMEADRVIKNNTRWVWEAGPGQPIPRTGAETIFTLEPVPDDIKINNEDMKQIFEDEIGKIREMVNYVTIKFDSYRSPLHMPVFRGE